MNKIVQWLETTRIGKFYINVRGDIRMNREFRELLKLDKDGYTADDIARLLDYKLSAMGIRSIINTLNSEVMGYPGNLFNTIISSILIHTGIYDFFISLTKKYVIKNKRNKRILTIIHQGGTMDEIYEHCLKEGINIEKDFLEGFIIMENKDIRPTDFSIKNRILEWIYRVK